MRRLSWPHCGPLPPGNALTAGRADTRGPPGYLPLPLPTTVACSYPRWLRPRRHAEYQDLAQCPDMIGQASGHGWRTRPPLRGRARAVSGPRLQQGLAYARMREAKIIVDLIQGELLPQAVLPLA